MLDGRWPARPSRVKLLSAFAAIYLLWGSTYLAIRYAIETLPPYLMAGTRFLVAGTVLYLWARWRGAQRPNLIHWRAAMIVGALLLLGGNGNVVWAEQRVPSGLAALLVATEPLWIVVLNWVRPGGIRPSGRIALGLAVGFAGVALLVGPGSLMGGSSVDLMGAGALTLAALSWAAGSLYVTRARLPASPIMAAAAEMLAGGTLLLLAGFLTGEAGRVQLSAISLRSIVSVGYLIIFGSLVGFTAYNWLLGVTTPARASTYAYVNPVVAVLLGWAVAGEPLSIRMLLAAAVIIAAVVLITTHRLPRAARAEKKLIASATPADPFIRDAVPAHRNGVGKRPADVIKDAPVAGSIDPVGHHIEERHESR